jgi:hypothetical protein
LAFAVNGEMNCALTSGGETSRVVASERSRNAFGCSGPGFARVRDAEGQVDVLLQDVAAVRRVD